METFKVAGYMRKVLISFEQQQPISVAVDALMNSEEIGAPVLDGTKLVGWISEQDCLAKMIEATYHCELVCQVQDVMRTEVLTVDVTDDVLDVARQMLDIKPKVYPVLDDGELVGIITRRDILKAVNLNFQHNCFKK